MYKRQAPETETNSTAVPVSYLISPALAPPTTSTYASAAASSTLSLAGSPWTISPSLSGKPITVFGDYAVTYNPVTLTIIQAPTTIASAIAATTELPTVASGVAAVTKATDSISVGSAVPGGSGLPTGTVTVYDTITTLPNNGASGVGTVYLPCTLPLTANVSAGSSDIFVASNYDLFVGETVTGLSAFTASTTTGSPTLSAVSTSTTLYPGEIVTGAGIPSGSTIVGVGQGSITLSANATATAAGITVNAYVIPSGTTIPVSYTHLVAPTEQPHKPSDPPLIGELDPRLKAKPLVRFDLEYFFPTRQIAFTEDASGVHNGSLQFEVVAYDVYGKLITRLSQKRDLVLTADKYQQFIKSRDQQFFQQIDLPHGEIFLRAGILDGVSDKVGTLEIPLLVTKNSALPASQPGRGGGN